MPVPNQREVEAVISKYARRIRRAVDAGFRAYVRRIGGAPNRFARTDSADTFDCVAQAIAREFSDGVGGKILDGRGTLKLLLDGRVLVRFKKAGRNGVGSNLRTRANDRFLDPSLPYEDAPRAAKVEICWTVNDTGTSFDSLRVIARDGAAGLWSFDLPGAAPLPLFEAKPAAPAEARPRRSVAKLKVAKRGEREAS
jgi:hypothetical protein